MGGARRRVGLARRCGISADRRAQQEETTPGTWASRYCMTASRLGITRRLPPLILVTGDKTTTERKSPGWRLLVRGGKMYGVSEMMAHTCCHCLRRQDFCPKLGFSFKVLPTSGPSVLPPPTIDRLCVPSVSVVCPPCPHNLAPPAASAGSSVVSGSTE